MSNFMSKQNEIQRVGEKLRTLRKRNQLTQQDVAEQLNVSWQYVSKLERGIKLPNAAMLVKLSRLFEVSVDVILKDELELDG